MTDIDAIEVLASFSKIAIFIYTNYIAILEKDANTSIASISVKNMFNSVLIYLFIYLSAVAPTMSYELVDKTKKSVYTTPLNPHTADSKLNEIALNTSSNLKTNQQIDTKIPLFFSLFDVAQHVIIGGTQRALSSLNINDIRSNITTTMQNNAINTPALKRFYNEFINKCYNPTKQKFDYMVNKGYITTDNFWTSDIDQEEYDWAGASYFLKTKGFYKPCPTGKCQPDDVQGSYGMVFKKNVSCDHTWDKTLKPALIKEFNIDEVFANKDKALGKYNTQKLKEFTIRAYLKAEKTVDQKEGDDWGIIAALKTVVSWVIGLLGSFVVTFIKTITTYLVTVILPMIQALLLFVIVIVLPILLPFSAFRIDYLFGIFMAMFTIQFVTIIIAVIQIVDNSLLALMAANSPSDNGFMQAVHIAGSGNGLEFFLINLLILFFYIIAIKLWFTFMAEFGGKIIGEISSSMDSIGDMGITDKSVGIMSKK